MVARVTPRAKLFLSSRMGGPYLVQACDIRRHKNRGRSAASTARVHRGPGLLATGHRLRTDWHVRTCYRGGQGKSQQSGSQHEKSLFHGEISLLKWELHRDNVTAEGFLRRNRGGFCLPENVTEMTLKSALDDLSRTTLEAVTGCLSKLEYLAGLRHRAGDYAHWGMGKVYGRSTANKALGTAHREVVSVVLSTPLGTLLEDVEKSSAQAGVDAEKYLGGLARRPEDVIAQRSRGGIGAPPQLSSARSRRTGADTATERHAPSLIATPTTCPTTSACWG